MFIVKKCYFIIGFSLLFIPNILAQGFIDVESGVAFAGYNDVRIPSETGTMFSISEETPSGLVPMFRIRAGYTFANRHTLYVLAAPLTAKGSGTISQDVDYQDTTFTEGSKLTSSYRFDSYRISYRWSFFKSDNLELGVGLTGKIRSADISLMDSTGYASRDDLGVVPLINFRAEWFFKDNFGILVDGDALVTPFGRAEDVNLALLYRYSPDTVFRIGYRVLEGGSDGGGDVYTFSLYNFITAGITVSI